MSDGILYYYNHNSIITRYQQQQTNNRQATVFHPQLSAQIFIGSSVFKSLTALNAMRKCRAHMSYFRSAVWDTTVGRNYFYSCSMLKLLFHHTMVEIKIVAYISPPLILIQLSQEERGVRRKLYINGNV